MFSLCDKESSCLLTLENVADREAIMSKASEHKPKPKRFPFLTAPDIRALIAGDKVRHTVPLVPQPVEIPEERRPDSGELLYFKHPKLGILGSVISPSWLIEHSYYLGNGKWWNPIPYSPGQILWCAENFWIEHDTDCVDDGQQIIDCGYCDLKEDYGLGLRYCATDNEPSEDFRFYSKHPSTHMSEWASRLTLKVTDVREPFQIQGMSEEDAEAHGVLNCSDRVKQNAARYAAYIGKEDVGCVDYFRQEWNAKYAKRACWDDNPWVFSCGIQLVEGDDDANT